MEKVLMEYTNTLPAYTIGNDAYHNVAEVVKLYGTKAVVVGGPRAITAWKPEWQKAKQAVEITSYLLFGGEADTDVADTFKDKAEVKAADMIFAVGGGKSMDFCKYLAHITHKALFTFPTIASTCAPITKLGVFYDANHAFTRQINFGIPPCHVFINTKIIAEAPSVYLWAGIGDTLAKNYEAHFTSRADGKPEELDHSNWLGLTIAPISSEGLVKHGTQGMKDCEGNKATYELEQSILAIIVSTGLVSINVLESYNSSLAHSLYYALTNLKQIDEHHLHGEVVSYGVLVLLTMDNNLAERNKLFKFMKSVKLPTCLADIDVTLQEADKVLDKAVNGGSLGKHAYPITIEMVHNAIVSLEKYNESEK